MNGRRQRRLRPAQPEAGGGRDRSAGSSSCSRWCGSTQFAEPEAGAAVGRPAAAGGAGAGPGQLSQRAPARRAARRARPQAAPGDADRAQAHPARGRHHVHLRDPRPGRGAHDVRPDRGDERGPGRADRVADRRSTTRPRRCSSPASSASPTCCPASMGATNGSHATITVAGNRPIYVPAGEWRFRAGVAGDRDGPPGAPAPRRTTAHRRNRAFPSRCDHAVFQGPVIRCALRRAGRHRDRRPTSDRRTRSPGSSAGQTLWATWEPDAARLLPPAGPPRPGAEADLRTTVERAATVAPSPSPTPGASR